MEALFDNLEYVCCDLLVKFSDVIEDLQIGSLGDVLGQEEEINEENVKDYLGNFVMRNSFQETLNAMLEFPALNKTVVPRTRSTRNSGIAYDIPDVSDVCRSPIPASHSVGSKSDEKSSVRSTLVKLLRSSS